MNTKKGILKCRTDNEQAGLSSSGLASGPPVTRTENPNYDALMPSSEQLPWLSKSRSREEFFVPPRSPQPRRRRPTKLPQPQIHVNSNFFLVDNMPIYPGLNLRNAIGPDIEKRIDDLEKNLPVPMSGKGTIRNAGPANKKEDNEGKE